MKIAPSFEEFKTFPKSVQLAVGYTLLAWIWFYIAMYAILMPGNVSPRFLIGIAVSYMVIRINKVGRVLCMLAQVMIILQISPVALALFSGELLVHGISAALIVLLFGFSTYYLFIKETAEFFKAYNKKEAGDAVDPSKPVDETENLDPHTLLGISPNAGRQEIEAAYRRMKKRYGPAHVTGKGDAYKELAQKRFQQIQKAYKELISR